MHTGDFATMGIIKCESVFSARDAARMGDVLWNELERRYGLERDDPSSWDRHPPYGLKSTKKSAAFAPILGPKLCALLDDLFAPDGWTPPKSFGNVLVTMPDAAEWRVPHRLWHSDFLPTLPTHALAAVKVWALCADVERGGGGTPQLAGSHVAFARYLAHSQETDYKRAKFGFLRSHPALRQLTHDDADADRNDALMRKGIDIDGTVLRVIECTGAAGDVYVTHPWVFHTIATNASRRPRFMRSFAISRASTPSETPSLQSE